MAYGAILGQRSGVQTVNGQLPDASGNVEVTATGIGAMSTSGGTFTGTVNMNNQTLNGIKTPVNTSEAAPKGYVDQREYKKIVATNQTVASSSFSVNSEVPDFGFRAAVPISGVTADMIPEVTFSATDAVSGVFAPVAQPYSGGVYIYANVKPTTTITIPTIVVWRGN